MRFDSNPKRRHHGDPLPLMPVGIHPLCSTSCIFGPARYVPPSLRVTPRVFWALQGLRSLGARESRASRWTRPHILYQCVQISNKKVCHFARGWTYIFWKTCAFVSPIPSCVVLSYSHLNCFPVNAIFYFSIFFNSLFRSVWSLLFLVFDEVQLKLINLVPTSNTRFCWRNMFFF